MSVILGYNAALINKRELGKMENNISFISLLTDTEQRSFITDSDLSTFSTDTLSTDTIPEEEYKRRLLYLENKELVPTTTKPTLAGIHLSQRNVPIFTLRHFDTKYYTMVIHSRSANEITTTKNNFVKLCCKIRSCKATVHIRCSDLNLLDKHDLEALLNPNIWTLGDHKNANHTCNMPVPPYMSDKKNFSHLYKELKLDLNDLNGETAWKVMIKKFESGTGAGYDAVIQGVKMDHHNKIYYARKRKAMPANQNAISSKDLIIADQFQSIEYSEMYGPENLPRKKIKKWFRKVDQYGNLYFQTVEDSKLLYESREFHIDGTFQPVGGIKHFAQLYIFCIRLNLPSSNSNSSKKIFCYPVSFIFAVNRLQTNYLEIFENIKLFVKEDMSEGQIEAELMPDFIHMDAEKSAINAAQIHFPRADIIFCFFHTLQAWRRKLVVLGFKCKLERGPKFDQNFRNFWDFVSGIPSANLRLPEKRNIIVNELRNYPVSLELLPTERVNLQIFCDYLLKYYIEDNALFPYDNWGQYSNINFDSENYSRTSNASESIHSSLNRHFKRRYTFDTVIERLHLFKVSAVLSYYAYFPLPFFNIQPKPSRKKPIKKSDQERLSAIYHKINQFNLQPINDQLVQLVDHLKTVGAMRAKYYTHRSILFEDETFDFDEIDDSLLY